MRNVRALDQPPDGAAFPPDFMLTNSEASSGHAEARVRRLTLVLFILSFLLHLGVVLALRHYQHPILWENGGIASSLYEGHGFRLAYFGPTAEPTSVQAPGYPVLLWGFWEAFGQTPRAYLILSAIQCLALASMVWPVGMLSRRWFPDVPVWIAQAIVAVYPLYLWYGTRIHHTGLVMAMHPWLLWAWLAWCRRGPFQGIATGLFSGLAGLFQPVLLGVYAICGAALLAGAAASRRWKPAISLLAAALAVVACLTPWTIRNYKVHGRLILVKSGMAKEFWMGNNPHATGTAFATGGAEEITNVYPPKAYALRGKLSEIQMTDALDAEAWAYIKANPGRTVEMTLKKILWFWTVPPRDLVRSSQEGEALTYRGIQIAYWAIIVILAVIGIAASPHPVKEYLAVMALYVGVYSAVYGMTHVGQARFRGEIEFIFLFGAAAGIYFSLKFIGGKIAEPRGARSS